MQPEDHEEVERLARYLLHPPVSLERMTFDESSGQLVYRRKRDRGFGATKTFDALDFLARMLMHIPEPRRHSVLYYGWYSSVARSRRPKLAGDDPLETESAGTSEEDSPDSSERRRLRRLWASMLRRIYEIDPLACRFCGSEMRVISFIMDPRVVRRILDHVRRKDHPEGRGPPVAARAGTLMPTPHAPAG